MIAFGLGIADGLVLVRSVGFSLVENLLRSVGVTPLRTIADDMSAERNNTPHDRAST